MEGIDSVKRDGLESLPPTSWAENTIMTNCTQEVAGSSLNVLSSLWSRADRIDNTLEREGLITQWWLLFGDFCQLNLNSSLYKTALKYV
jgi:hypothetical protein